MGLAGWLEPLPDAEQQRAVDTWAIDELGIPSPTLMERAGTGLARMVSELAPDGAIAVVAGKGNNGGDGLIAARLLRDRGREVTTYEVDAYVNLEGAAVVIDALLGTGFKGAPHGWIADAIDVINAARRRGAVVFACDSPSGVNASTGEVTGQAVEADHTVSFHAAKPGLWLAPGKASAGQVTIVDIGIPAERAPVEVQTGLLTDRVLALVPRREAASTKFSSGHVLVVGGSARYTGAPAMSAMAAARAGAGYVTVAVTEAAVPILQTKLLEEMVTDHGQARDVADRAGALVVGPGIGRSSDAVALVRGLVHDIARPMVLDADGLFAFNGELPTLRERDAPTVLTPHAGELGRLLEVESSEIAEHRLARATEASELSGAVVVLKGDDTIIVSPDGRTAISPGGVPALATAGTGDVLSGVIGAYLARGMAAFEAACAGVYAHLRAGALAAEEIGADGVIASDVILRLPRTLASAG